MTDLRDTLRKERAQRAEAENVILELAQSLSDLRRQGGLNQGVKGIGRASSGGAALQEEVQYLQRQLADAHELLALARATTPAGSRAASEAGLERLTKQQRRAAAAAQGTDGGAGDADGVSVSLPNGSVYEEEPDLGDASVWRSAAATTAAGAPAAAEKAEPLPFSAGYVSPEYRIQKLTEAVKERDETIKELQSKNPMAERAVKAEEQLKETLTVVDQLTVALDQAIEDNLELRKLSSARDEQLDAREAGLNLVESFTKLQNEFGDAPGMFFISS